MKSLRIFVVCLLVVGSVYAGERVEPIRPVNTYSIVAYDSTTGHLGAAVQSHWFKVADVIWAEPGLGAVATQSLAEISYGPLALEMLRVGRSPQEALDGLLTADPNSAVRQVAIIDALGETATHTGDLCIAEAGHRWGPGYSCQANLMRDSTVWDAMGEAFESTQGDLAAKMMAALEAAQAEGGDIRGKQSAAMIVVAAQPSGRSWDDRLIDIRVDDHAEPLKELRRLLNVNRAYNLMNIGDELLAEGMIEEAAEAYLRASELAPGNAEILFWHAVTLVDIGQIDHALPIFKEVFEMDEAWRELVPRLVESELMPQDSALIERIVGQ
ncbi:DUF1028 domain-containing protein [candidate division GN15 bacterium]|nr:DUF1028 domain-containing protein [candidate division GN15 bacterium]